MTELTDDLFESAAGMAGAANYADWTFDLFDRFVGASVLEVGCGVGTFTRKLAADARVKRLLAIDISPAAVDKCRQAVRNPNVELRVADVRDIGEQWDLVICMNVLEHIEDDRGALAHLWSLVAGGGTLFLLVPAHQALFTPFDAESGHFRRYNRRRMLELMGDAGVVPAARRAFYFNSIGALGYWAVYKVLRKAPRESAGSEIGWFDRLVVPWQRRLEPRRLPFGISLVVSATKARA